MPALTTEAFWMVWNPRGNNPTHEHGTVSSAISEAERLARTNPGEQFFVLQAIELRVVNDMQRIKLNEIPF